MTIEQDIFWISDAGVHECWRRAQGISVYGYQKVGQYYQDKKSGGFSAIKNPLPSGLPVVRLFTTASEAKQWIEA